jgi:hypothetical protein
MRLTSLLLLLGCGSAVTAPLDPTSQDTGDASDANDTDDIDDTDDTADPDTGGFDAGGSTDDTGTDSEPSDYTVDGPHVVTALTETVAASCDMQTQVFTPDIEDPDLPLIVLGHGFARGADQLVGWAEHLASWGFTVAVPALCHSSIWDTDHEANGTDMLAIPDALGALTVIYGGHSAGGLAAFVSGALDSRAIGVIGLDATDADDIGLDYAALLTVPALGLLGEPSSCNADSNGAALYQTASSAVAVRVTDADHCDYESDTDWLCTSFCTNAAATFSDADIQTAIRGLMTAAVFEILDEETGWWESGSFYEALVAEGRITPL